MASTISSVLILVTMIIVIVGIFKKGKGEASE